MTPATATTPNAQPATANSESAKQPQSLLSQAVDMRKEWEDNETSDRRTSREQVVALYVELLNRNNNPQEGDARELATTMLDLEIDAAVVERDLKIIKRARWLQGLHDEKDAAHKNSIAATEEYRSMEKRHKQEERAAYLKKGSAQGHLSQCSGANHDLNMLRRSRPLLFTAGGDRDPRVRLLETVTVT